MLLQYLVSHFMSESMMIVFTVEIEDENGYEAHVRRVVKTSIREVSVETTRCVGEECSLR